MQLLLNMLEPSQQGHHLAFPNPSVALQMFPKRTGAVLGGGTRVPCQMLRNTLRNARN